MPPQRSCPWVALRRATELVPHPLFWEESKTSFSTGRVQQRACALAACSVIRWRPRHRETRCLGDRVCNRCVTRSLTRGAVSGMQRQPGMQLTYLRGSNSGSKAQGSANCSPSGLEGCAGVGPSCTRARERAGAVHGFGRRDLDRGSRSTAQ